MPTLNWIGKDKVINHHRDVQFRILEHKYSFSAKEGEKTEHSKSGNKIIHGDNLEALKSLLPQYEGKIKCIYIDPPYNTGNEGWVYNDNVNHPKIKKWLGDIVGKDGEDLTRHDKWLCMMYPRLKLLHKLLADDGVIFISIDDNEQANLKLICDEIFGNRNFLATLFWRGMHTVRNSSKDFNKNTEYIICFCKNKAELIPSSDADYYLRYPKDKSQDYKLNDNNDKGFYKLDPIYARNYAKPYLFTFKNGITWEAPRGNYPRYSEESLSKLEENNELVFSGKEPKAKRYLNKVQVGVPPSTLLESDIVGFNKDATLLLNDIFAGNKVFDQPKTPKLLEFLFKITRKVDTKDYTILDSFAGSGTTAHAVLNLNKEDGGNRKFILIEMEAYANEITAERVKRVAKGYGEGKKAVAGTGGEFDYYELGMNLFDEHENLNEEIGIQKIREYIWYSETRSHFIEPTEAITYFLGKKNDTVYYFVYEKESLTTLDFDTLSIVQNKGEQYIIYADNCLLPVEFLRKNNIVFKKIPRDITKF